MEFAGGRKIAASEFRVESVREQPFEGGKQLVLHFTHKDSTVQLITAMKPGQWWARRWLTVRTGPGRLEGVTFARWDCQAAQRSFRGGLPQRLRPTALCRRPFPGHRPSGRRQFHDGKRRIVPAGGVRRDRRGYSRPIAGIRARRRRGRHCPPRILGVSRRDAAGRRHMIFLVNDWYWSNKSRPLEAMQGWCGSSRKPAYRWTPSRSTTGGMAIGTRRRDCGDASTGSGSPAAGRRPGRRPRGQYRRLALVQPDRRLRLAEPAGGIWRTHAFEVHGDALCLTGPRYQKHVMESFSRWAAEGMDYIEVDGFWPDWGKMDRAIQQIDALIRVFAEWHKANPKLVIGYTSGSNSSPFWLQHCDYVWRGGSDDDHAGMGDPFDRYHTFVDDCLQLHRDAEMPISGFVTFDIVQGRTRSSSREAFGRVRGGWPPEPRCTMIGMFTRRSDDRAVETPGAGREMGQIA